VPTLKARLAPLALPIVLMLAGGHAGAAEALPADTFAIVGPVTLSAVDFRSAYGVAARSKFYHSKPPEHEVAVFQREVGDELVNRVLVVEEAKRQGIKADPAVLKEQMARYEQRARHAPNWAAEQDRMRAAMATQFENQDRYEQLAIKVRTVAEPTEQQLRDYYARHKDLFVEPAKVRVSVILLKVDPSAPKPAWEAARAEAAKLKAQLAGGADFAQLARLHSADATAANGGDMGYLHRGMLPDGVDTVVDGLKPGEVSAPVSLLEGVALLRLEGRQAAQQRPFADVRPRAVELWKRDESERRWKKFIADLRKATPVRINESLYLPLPKAPTKAG
jgi:parvulin-like peptidyl-prolyl isomerase